MMDQQLEEINAEVREKFEQRKKEKAQEGSKKEIVDKDIEKDIDAISKNQQQKHNETKKW